MTSISELKLDEFDALVQQVKDLANDSVRSGTAMHVVEQQLLVKLLQIGHAAIKAMFQAVGTGDVGESITHPDHDKPLKRFPELSNRAYRSIFGDFELAHCLYGKAPSQKAIVIPFDEHFGLPPNRFSLLLESWVAQLSASEAIHEAMDKLDSILGIRIAVDSAERILARTGANAEHFQDNLPAVEVADEGELLIESTDNKGIVMRNKPKVEKQPVGAPANRTGPVPDRKQMAAICGCYSVDRWIRTPDEVLRSLFHEPTLENDTAKRPRPIQSRYQACMSRTQEHVEDSLDGEVSAIGWLSEHVRERRRKGQELINLNDGEISIWANIELMQGQNGRVDIIDLLHAIQRVWDAAVILKPVELFKFARTHIGSILSGNVKRVIQSFRWQSTRLKLEGKPSEGMEKICRFLERNADRMRYDEYLAKGYPISTGFIEGACRHVIKDRKERSGMRWTIAGAQSMLYLRCIDAGKLWKEFHQTHQTRVLSRYGDKRSNFIDSFQLAA